MSAIGKSPLHFVDQINVFLDAKSVRRQGLACHVGNQLLKASSVEHRDKDGSQYGKTDPRYQEKGDSVGGVIRCVVLGCPVGLGEPVFDKLEADLAKGMMSLSATKGFEIGMGFGSTLLFGSEHKDAFEVRGGKVRTRANRSGGIQGGISNGETIDMRIAFEPWRLWS